MSESTKAVFLSYAREDTDAARRIADALRGFGIVVWFDQSELRGGDTWDVKIRNQIRTCALFLPIVSATTEARGEGYFRREWKFAVDRTHDMAEGLAFIMPIVIDGTLESAATVPGEFMRFQWTRLPGGQPTPEFVMQVKRLLENPRQPAARTGETQGATRAARPTAIDQPGERPRPTQYLGFPMVALGAVAVLVVGLVAWYLLKPRPSPQEVAALTASAQPHGDKTAEKAKPAPAEPAAPQASDKSIAVLPFENMSEDKEGNAFFADGVHEDLLTNLAFIRDLRVVSRTSVMQYRSTTKPISQIAAELKVAYVLEGSVRRAGNKVRVTGQLIRAATDEHVWAKSYDRDISDVFAIQSELAQAIAGALQSVLSPETKALIERRPTENAAAYDAFVRAREQFNSGVFADARDMAVLLRRAVELDPNFAAAWAMLGSREAFVYFKTEQTPAQLALAKAAIDRAVALAPDDPAVIEALGDYYYYGHRDYARATEQYQRLARLRPNDADVYSSLGNIYRRQGHVADALPNYRRGAELDPQNLAYVANVFYSLLGCRQYPEAEARARRFVAEHPGHLSALGTFAEIVWAAHHSDEGVKMLAALEVPTQDRPERNYVMLGLARATANWAEAIRLEREQRYFDGDDDFPRFMQDVLAAATLAEADDVAGSRQRAAEALADMNALLAKQPNNAQLRAALSLAHGLLGHHDEAVQCGEKARSLLPESRDAMNGTWVSALCASALAYAGEKDRALAEFERLLHVPFGTNAVLDRGIFIGSWKPLRSDPRFQALINDPKNNAPLY